jgi:DNA-binding response OmpR family regulator
LTYRTVAHSLRLAIIEPDTLVRDALCAMVARRGYRVQYLDSLEAALAQEAANTFDFLLISLPEPEEQCRAVIARLRSASASLRARVLLLTSGATDAELRVTATDDGLALLHKPFAGTQLLARIEALFPPVAVPPVFASPRAIGGKRRLRAPEGVPVVSS